VAARHGHGRVKQLGNYQSRGYEGTVVTVKKGAGIPSYTISTRPEKYRLQALQLLACIRNCPKIFQKLIEKTPTLHTLILLDCSDFE